MNEYAPFYIIAFMFVFSVFIVLKAYEHQLKLKQKQAALKQLLENDDAAIHLSKLHKAHYQYQQCE